MSAFFEEVRRRKVFRVAGAYGVVAWLIIQISATVFPAWELPNWALRLVIVLVLMGFPIALILAWAFDVTPSGIRRDEMSATAESPSVQRRSSRNLFLLLVSGVVLSLAAGFFLLPRASARKIEKSIAVLPFENLSDDKENAYFADGLQDDVLTNLSKIGDLKVISRTSVMAYRGQSRNVREIGKALGASTILEGSVRRSGNRIRLNVQLINAETDEHIWANDYDRDLTDVFAIQSDLAHEIASQLQARLSPDEIAQVQRKPTENMDAYLVYMQGQELFHQSDKFRENIMQAEQLVERATKLDPKFADAFALLGTIENWIFHSFDPVPVRRAKARAAVDESLRLQPNLPRAHLAQGFYFYYVDRDYERALAEFAVAQRGLPNSAEIYMARGAIERRQGKWAESTADLEKAVSLDPKNAWVLQNLAINYQATGNYEKGEKFVDRALETSPTSFGLRGLRAKFAIEARGDLSVADKELAAIASGKDPNSLVTFARINLFMLRRQYAEALVVLDSTKEEIIHGESTAPMPTALLRGMCHVMLNDKERARPELEEARKVVERYVQESPEDPERRVMLGWVLALLGEKEAAIAEGQRGVALRPESQDALDGPSITTAMAQIYAWVGEKEKALQLLERLVATPNGITPAILKLDPTWDPLRDEPRFQQLVRKGS